MSESGEQRLLVAVGSLDGDTLTVKVQVEASTNATDVMLGLSSVDFIRTTRLD